MRQYDWMNKKEQIQRRLQCRRDRRDERKKKIAELSAEIDKLRRHEELNPCSFCRDLPYGAQELKFDCDWRYGLKIDQKEDRVYCPKCNKVMAQWQ